MSVTLDHEGAAPTTADPRRWRALGLILLGAFMDILDATVVTLAIPFIQRDLGASYAQMQWVLAGYQLAFATLLITGGRLGDIFGRRRLYLWGVAGFSAASVLCGLARSPEMLIVARVAQGALGGLMVPQVLSLIQASFQRRERGAAFGVYGAVLGLSNVAGPFIAGLLLQGNVFGLEWRPIFLMNLPIGLVTFLGAVALVRESRSEHPLHLDLGGVVLAAAGLLLVLYPLVQGREMGWPAWSFVALAAAVPMFAGFALYEWRKTRADGSPLIPTTLFGQRAFVGGLLVALCLFAGIVAFFVVYAVFVQVGLGLSPIQAALGGVAWPVAISVASGLSIQLAPRIGRALLSLGTALLVLGMGMLIIALRLAGADVTVWHFVPGMFIRGFGMGMVVPTLTDFVLAGVSERDAGAASGVINTIMQVGGAAGVALIGVVFFGLLASQAGPSAEFALPRLRAELAALSVPAPVQEQIAAAFVQCAEEASAASDRSVPPAACRPSRGPIDARVAEAVQATSEEVRRRVFVTATEGALWYEVAVFILSFLLIPLLPAKPHGRDAGTDGAVPG